MHVCMYIHVSMFAHADLCVYICVRVYLYAYRHAFIYFCVHVCVHPYVTAALGIHTPAVNVRAQHFLICKINVKSGEKV